VGVPRSHGGKRDCGVEVEQVSISSTFYVRLFCTKELCANFLLLLFGFVTFWQKNIGTKVEHKMLIKLTPGIWSCERNLLENSKIKVSLALFNRGSSKRCHRHTHTHTTTRTHTRTRTQPHARTRTQPHALSH